VTQDPTRAALRVSLSPALADDIADIVTRVRRLFDLDAQPDKIAAHFAADPMLGPCVAARPGLRVPGAYEPFEMALRAILNQQVSVRAAITLAGRVVSRFGAPTPEKLAVATIDELRVLGLTQARAATLLTLARALVDGALTFDPSDPEATMAALVALPGIGPWTANYVAMRGLSWPDAFPAGDLGIKKALGLTSEKAILARAEAWRPWRAYAVMHLWNRSA
jgi:AraC family transcriptional regulator of adaptative response / DNA-3-methyladenine glycosylase II